MSEAPSIEEIASAVVFPEDDQPAEESKPVDEQAEAVEEAQEQPSAEDPEEEGEESPESDEESEQSDQPKEESAEDPVVEWVDANGEAQKVPMSELKLGYMRAADYTHKTQNLAAERREAEQALQSKIQEAERYTADLGKLAALGEQVKSYEAWLAQAGQRGEDPQAIAQAQSQYLLLRQQHEDSRAGLLQKRQQLMQEAEQQRAQQFQQANKEALEHLGKVIPNFVPEKHIAALREYGIKAGYEPEELAQVADKRHFEVLWKASQWDALQAKKPEAVAKVKAAPPKTTKGGNSVSPPTAIDRAEKQFKAKKDVRSFAALLAAADFVK